MKPRSKPKSPAAQEIRIGDVRIFELRDVAARLGISTTTLRRYIRQGDLAGKKVGGRWLISESSIEQFFLSPYRRPRTKKPKLGQS
jgi:excisionase family DNA binding protein